LNLGPPHIASSGTHCPPVTTSIELTSLCYQIREQSVAVFQQRFDMNSCCEEDPEEAEQKKKDTRNAKHMRKGQSKRVHKMLAG